MIAESMVKLLNFTCRFCLLAAIVLLVACRENETDEKPFCERTLFMYLPWSTNLTPYFYTNISDMEKAVREKGLDNERVVVFLSTTSSEASMFEIVYENGETRRNTLKTYDSPAFTTVGGLAAILNDVKSFAPARSYAMTIGCHGMGWLPVHGSRKSRSAESFKPHWEYDNAWATRYFGGASSAYQTDISTLAESLEQAGMPMEFILFDDCYMSSIEVAYTLRHVADYLIACPTEIMAFGMPYAEIGKYLLGEPDYEAVCREFKKFYAAYRYPYATFGITRSSELETLASLMKEINGLFVFDETERAKLQPMDGYDPAIFYDYGDYVSHLCSDSVLLEQFNEQLGRAVPYKAHTEKYYSAAGGVKSVWTFSGITTSAPSISPQAADWVDTDWYRATH